MQIKLKTALLNTYKAVNAGHIGCSLSCLDILIAIFFKTKSKEDVFILSKGHAANALYCVLHELGDISIEDMATYYQNGTQFPAHPGVNVVSSIPFATGSLGHGFPIATGIAKAKKLKKDSNWVYVLMSDGETNEGTTWESAHFAVSHQLNNLIVLIDKNKIQGFGFIKDILGDTAASTKWEQIGFEIAEVNGHDLNAISLAIQKLQASNSMKPKLIIADTIKGKGVSFMENTVDWHYLPMSDVQFAQALGEIQNPN